MIEVRVRLLLALCRFGLQSCAFWCTIATPFGSSHWGRRTNALVQPQEEGCRERSRALHRRRGRAMLWGATDSWAFMSEYERLRDEGMGIEQAMIFVGQCFSVWHLRHQLVG